jgi:hypothetical protein
VDKFTLTGFRFQDRTARRENLYRLRYPSFQLWAVGYF